MIDLCPFVMYVCQFTQDFVRDCIALVFAYVSDPSRRSRFTDQLEEEVVHHGAILQRHIVDNANLEDTFGMPVSLSAMPSVPSMITGQQRTARLVNEARK